MTRSTHAGAFRVRFVATLTALYLVVIVLVTLTPTPVDSGLDPYIERLLAKLWQRGLPTFVDYMFIEFSANVVFFVPLGFLAGLLLTRRTSWLAVFGGAILSTAIEGAQAVFLSSRFADPGDVAANTSGALIGWLVAVAVRGLILHRDVLVIRDVGEGRRASNGLPVRE